MDRRRKITSTVKTFLFLIGAPIALELVFEFFKHISKNDRSSQLINASEAFMNIEKANKNRIETLEKLVDLMKISGASQEEINAQISLYTQGFKIIPFEKILSHIDSGKIKKIILTDKKPVKRRL